MYTVKVNSFYDSECECECEYVDSFSCDSMWLLHELIEGLAKRDTCYNYFIVVYEENNVLANIHIRNKFYGEKSITTNYFTREHFQLYI